VNTVSSIMAVTFTLAVYAFLHYAVYARWPAGSDCPPLDDGR